MCATIGGADPGGDDVFPYVFSMLYVLSALGVGYLARHTRFGWFGVFLVSLIVTPLITFICVVGLARRGR